MDAQAPPPPALVEPAPPRVNAVAAQDLYARDAHERDLCKSASHPDWLYLSIPPVLLAGAIVLDTQVFKYDGAVFGYAGNPAVRDIGPSLVGLTWGFFLGSFMPAMPKCSPHFVSTVPAEGQVRTPWALAFGIALLAGMTAPILDYAVVGGAPDTWDNGERVSRVILSASLAFGAALLPYLLPPKTVRAARELEKIRATVSPQATFVSYTFAF